MSEQNGSSFQSAFADAINSFLQGRGGGFISAYTGVAEIVDHDGVRKILVAHSADTMPHQFMGLIEYHREYMKALAHSQWQRGGIDYEG